MNDKITVSADITPDDVAAYQKCMGQKLGVFRGNKLANFLFNNPIGLAVIFISYFAWCVVHKTLDNPFPSYMIGLLSGAGLMMFFVQVLSNVQAAQFRPFDDGPVFGKQETIATEDGIVRNCIHYHSLYYWPSIREINVTVDYIFIMTDRAVAFIVPRRAFATDNDWDQFLAILEKRSGKKRT